MCPSQSTHWEILDIPSVYPEVVHAYDTYLDAKGDWELSAILPSAEIDSISALQVDFNVIRNKFVEHSVEVPMTPAVVFRLVLLGLNTLQEKQELLPSLNQLGTAIPSSKAQVQTLWRQIPLHSVKIEADQSEVSCPGSRCLLRQVPPSCQLFIWHLPKWSPNVTKSRTLVDAESRKSQNLQAILSEGQVHLEDHSWFFCSSHRMFGYDVDAAIHDS